MSEILFRGKAKNQNDFYHFSNVWRDCIKDGFVLGSLIVSNDRYYICVSSIGANKSAINNGIVSIIEVIPETVGQCTGLTDKNGKKIFEGDICAIVGEEKEIIKDDIFVVSWEENCGFNLYTCFDYEIIGNIYDNSELLKGVKNVQL
jgi:uncharacterized phage protein (TIGR01671 family)